MLVGSVVRHLVHFLCRILAPLAFSASEGINILRNTILRMPQENVRASHPRSARPRRRAHDLLAHLFVDHTHIHLHSAMPSAPASAKPTLWLASSWSPLLFYLSLKPFKWQWVVHSGLAAGAMKAWASYYTRLSYLPFTGVCPGLHTRNRGSNPDMLWFLFTFSRGTRGIQPVSDAWVLGKSARVNQGGGAEQFSGARGLLIGFCRTVLGRVTGMQIYFGVVYDFIS